MPLVDDILDVMEGNIVTGLAIGVGAMLLSPLVIPVVAGIAKPLAKAAIKGGFVLYEKSKEVVAEVGEVVEDLVAEVQSELAEEQKGATSVTTPPGDTKR